MTMDANRKYLFFESYHNALCRVPDEVYGRIVRSMSDYVFNGVEPQLSDPTDLMAWELIKPILVKGIELSEIRASAGRSGKGKSRNVGNINAKKQNNTNQNKNNTNQNGIGKGVGIGKGIENKESTIVPKKDRLSLNLSKRKNNFKESLKPFVEFYGADMINDFYSYWTEPNKSNTKMRYELQKTWDIKRRLSRWANNDIKNQ